MHVDGLAALLLDERDRLRARVGAEVGNDDIGTLLGEALATCPSDAIGTAGHHRDLPVQPAHAYPSRTMLSSHVYLSA